MGKLYDIYDTPNLITPDRDVSEASEVLIDKWLTKAAHYEDLFIAGDEDKKKGANLAFRRAMSLDGYEYTGQNII